MDQARSFERDSAVCDYWLAHSKGFTIRERGRAVGTVEEVSLASAMGRADSLVVRSGRKQQYLVAERVAAVVPARKLLLIDPKPRHAHIRPIAVTLGRQAVATGHVLRSTGRTASGKVAPVLAALAAVSRAAVVTIWIEVRRWTPVLIRNAQIGLRRFAALTSVASRRLAVWLGLQVRHHLPRAGNLAAHAAAGAIVILSGWWKRPQQDSPNSRSAQPGRRT